MSIAQQQPESFVSGTKYYDDENFPYGFDRSGEFTSAQVAILTQKGSALKALALGQRAPVTAEEEAFVAFCRGDRGAESAIERAWERYCRVTQKDARFFTVGDSRPASAADSFDDDFDD
ncbi:DUF413 domain-containing protein [Motiliproteus sp. SC1-56]|uniref:DUF413 domain-containing protein n=1 Tax=Motiliproteus sp. SC1-56 TaxID=2799565 RepID=UPI001A8DD054|nr:DUF413 domain-containing protein [Motiliproteus sp. SC1-56]